MKTLLGIVVAVALLLPSKASAQASKVGVVTYQNIGTLAYGYFPGGTPLPVGWKFVASQPGPPAAVGSWVQFNAIFAVSPTGVVTTLLWFDPWPYPVASGDASLYGLAKIRRAP